MAAMSGAWLRKKVRHPWLGGPRRLTMYLATPDCATSNPSWRFQLMRANRIKEQEVEFVDDEDFVASIYEPDVAGPAS